MERLTYDFCIAGKHCWQVKGTDNLECGEVCKSRDDEGCNGCPIADAFDRLAAIEDILGDDYDLDRLKELVEADRDGRCVVFPCKVGDTLYRIGYTTCKNGETHPDSYGCCGCYDECDMKKCVKEFIIPDSQWILSNYTNIAGGDWYFTREAVEVALKRMEGEEK